MTPRPVEIVAADGCVLRGQLWPGESAWVVLLHDVGPEEDLDRWRSLIPSLLAERLSVVAVDLRGHGASDGERTDEDAVEDVAAIVRAVRARGAEAVVVVAVGVSVTFALRSAEMVKIDGLAALSAMIRVGEGHPEGTRPSRSREDGVTCEKPRSSAREGTGPSPTFGGRALIPRGRGVPKLFVVGAQDPAAREQTERIRAASIGWALAVKLPTEAQGTALLDGPWAAQVREQILAFVRERRFAASATASVGRGPVAPAESFLKRLGIEPKGEGR